MAKDKYLLSELQTDHETTHITLSPDGNTAFAITTNYFTNEGTGENPKTNLKTLDISNVENPRLISNYKIIPPVSYPRSFKISKDGQTGFLVAQDEVHIIDLTNLTKPKLVNYIDDFYDIKDLALSDDERTIFLTDLVNNLSIVDISSAKNPKTLFRATCGDSWYRKEKALLADNGKTILFTGSENGLSIQSNPTENLSGSCELLGTTLTYKDFITFDSVRKFFEKEVGSPPPKDDFYGSEQDQWWQELKGNVIDKDDLYHAFPEELEPTSWPMSPEVGPYPWITDIKLSKDENTVFSQYMLSLDVPGGRREGIAIIDISNRYNPEYKATYSRENDEFADFAISDDERTAFVAWNKSYDYFTGEFDEQKGATIFEVSIDENALNANEVSIDENALNAKRTIHLNDIDGPILDLELSKDGEHLFAGTYNGLSIIDIKPPSVSNAQLEGNNSSGLQLVLSFTEKITPYDVFFAANAFQGLSLTSNQDELSLIPIIEQSKGNEFSFRIGNDNTTIEHGEEIFLSYAKQKEGGIQDLAGNSLENFEIPIANPIPEPEPIAETPTQPDPTVEPNPPVKPDPLTGQDTVLANAQINKSATRISLEFTAALSTANTLSPFNFAITNSDGSAIDLRAVSVSKNNANQLNLKLNQGNQFAAGSTVQVAYTQPSNSTALTDAAGQPIESFSQSGISTNGTPASPTPEPITPDPTTPELLPVKPAPIAKYDLYQYEGGKDNRTTISFGDSKQRRKRETGVFKNDLNVELDPTKNPTTFVTTIRLGGAADSGKAGIIGQPITGTYGRLTLNADGSYAYNATKQAAADLLIGETRFDDFTYTISDGTNSSSASFSFAIAGSKQRPVEPTSDLIETPSTTTPEGNNNTPAAGTTINIENLTIKLGKGKTIDLIGDLISHAKTKGFLSANLFQASETSNQLKAKLPPQVALSHQGTDSATNSKQAKLILKGIYSTLNSKDGKTHQRVASRYLNALPSKRSARVDLRSITAESLRNDDKPLKTLGLSGTTKGRNLNEALILDGRNLPSQTNIRVDHIGFLSLFGDISISSGKGNIHVIGDRSAQTINFGNGDDTLIGGAGQDTLDGGKGDDSLDGGDGDDVLMGGPGADQFRLSKGQDLIEDFNLNQGDLLITSNPGKLSIQQEGDNLLITGPGGIDTFLANVDRRTFLAADPLV